LNGARWPEIKAAAAKLLPLPPGQNAVPLPPSRIGEAQRRRRQWREDFRPPEPGCINCHVVRGQGTELGPDLSEIGGKLGKDALYESILDPSAGISFSYEAWNIVLKNGDEPYGLIASETADELALKAVGGIVTRFKKSEIASRQQSKLSIMPAGLQQSMTTEEFVDLVEYLSTLKKLRRDFRHELEDATDGSRRREEAENADAWSIRLLTSAATIVGEQCGLEF